MQFVLVRERACSVIFWLQVQLATLLTGIASLPIGNCLMSLHPTTLITPPLKVWRHCLRNLRQATGGPRPAQRASLPSPPAGSWDRWNEREDVSRVLHSCSHARTLQLRHLHLWLCLLLAVRDGPLAGLGPQGEIARRDQRAHPSSPQPFHA